MFYFNLIRIALINFKLIWKKTFYCSILRLEMPNFIIIAILNNFFFLWSNSSRSPVGVFRFICFDFISLSFNMFNTMEMILKSTMNKLAVTRLNFYFNRVASFWNELSNSVLIKFNITNFKDQLDSKNVSKVTNNFAWYISWRLLND